MGTAVFVTFILAIKYNTPSNESILGAFSVSLVLYGIIMTIGGITGGCLNPAVGLIQSMNQFNFRVNSVEVVDQSDDFKKIDGL